MITAAWPGRVAWAGATSAHVPVHSRARPATPLIFRRQFRISRRTTRVRAPALTGSSAASVGCAWQRLCLARMPAPVPCAHASALARMPAPLPAHMPTCRASHRPCHASFTSLPCPRLALGRAIA
ncbi:hypothetical protein HAX54_048841 [Datura stramonium]|uniref:Uncharacterized protein n=1 Tax=Datura stramonium TaxID=4076 RepID=A0ABS8WNG8_DATST|nr:hypothetical protein [Datura stramonium]